MWEWAAHVKAIAILFHPSVSPSGNWWVVGDVRFRRWILGIGVKGVRGKGARAIIK